MDNATPLHPQPLNARKTAGYGIVSPLAYAGLFRRGIRAIPALFFLIVRWLLLKVVINGSKSENKNAVTHGAYSFRAKGEKALREQQQEPLH